MSHNLVIITLLSDLTYYDYHIVVYLSLNIHWVLLVVANTGQVDIPTENNNIYSHLYNKYDFSLFESK